MFSVILPTMWRGRGIDIMIEKQKMLDNPALGELLLINNDPPNARLFQHPKVRILYSGNNIYVNPAWNMGVEQAKFDKICLMSDDVIFDPGIFEQMCEYANSDNGIIGLGPYCDVGVNGWIRPRKANLVLAPGRHPEFNIIYGALMFFHKKSYTEIPKELKIFGGDTWIFAHNALRMHKKNWYIHNFDVVMTKGTTSFSSDMKERVQLDFLIRNEIFFNCFNQNFML